MRDLQRLAQQTAASEVSTIGYMPVGQHVPTPEKWTHSTVSKWHVRYSPPVSDLSLDYSVEALVEGSDMSMVHDGMCTLNIVRGRGLTHPCAVVRDVCLIILDGSMTPDLAWKYREGRQKRYGDKRVGGTIVVHFIKKNMWFLETAATFLQGEAVTFLERALGQTRSEPRADLGDSLKDYEIVDKDDLAPDSDSPPTSFSASLPIARHPSESSTHTKTKTNLQRLRRQEKVH